VVLQMRLEERRAQGPGQAQRENPDAGEPHPGMVVQPALLPQLARPASKQAMPVWPAMACSTARRSPPCVTQRGLLARPRGRDARATSAAGAGGIPSSRSARTPPG
jgi:hypothetical protein